MCTYVCVCTHVCIHTHIYSAYIFLPTFTISGTLPSFLNIQFGSDIISFCLKSNLPCCTDLLVTDSLHFQVSEMSLLHLRFEG